MLPRSRSATTYSSVTVTDAGVREEGLRALLMSASALETDQEPTSPNKVADCRRMSQDLLKLVGGMGASALNVLDVAQEEDSTSTELAG